MQAGNTTRGYGWVARFFHWTIAVLILTDIGLGLYAESLPAGSESDLARIFQTFSFHKTIGVTVLTLAVLRIIWALIQPHPKPLHPNRRAETLMAQVVHWGLYAGIIIMPLSGWLRHSSAPGEFARILWPLGQRLPGVPVDEAISAALSAVHEVSWIVLGGLIALHVLGAAKHAVIDRDATIARMAGRNAYLPEPPAGPHLPGFAAPLLALAIWAAAITLALGAEERETPPEPPATKTSAEAQPTAAPATEDSLRDVWDAQNGTLNITVVQGGSDVGGQFADWNADITYDEDNRTGHVNIEIPLKSLTLGSITSTALGVDFMNAENHPVSTFAADIAPQGDELIATGTMTLAGAEAPVTLPFTLTIEGDTATMTGQAILDRRDFQIGESYADESTVGFAVTVDVNLTATRQ